MVVEGRRLTLLSEGEARGDKENETGLPMTTTLVIDTSAQEVTVRCRAQSGRGNLRMFDGDAKEVSESQHNDDLKDGQIVRARFWPANYTALWHSEKVVECRRGEERGCRVRLIQVNNLMQPQANCARDNGHLLWCNISEWVDEADKQKSGGICDGQKLFHQPHFRYSFYNAEAEAWTSCGEFDERRTATVMDRDVAFLQCNISGVTQAVETLILRMEKIHLSQSGAALAFLKKQAQDCAESTYLAIPGDVLEAGSPGITTATAATIAVFVTAFILILCACLLRQLKRRSRKAGQLGGEGAVAYTNSEADLAYVKSERPLIPDSGNSRASAESGCSSNQESLEDVNNYLPMKCQDAESKEKLVDDLLNGNMERVNPHLPLTHQTRVLNYDKRFEVPRESFTIGHIIGEGQYGTVFVGTVRGIYGQELTKVAIKQVKDTLDPSQICTIIDELKILSNLNMHLNLVNLLGACTSQLARNEVYLLLEFCPFGDLKKFLVDKREKFLACLNNETGHLESVFNTHLLLSWAYSIAKGMEYLASKRIMHGDLAARNILVGEHYTAKISDFGLSKMMYYNQDYKKTERRMIPWAWMAVEYLQTGEFNIMSDVWSFGVTLWEIFSLGNKPYGLEPYEDMKVKILNGHRLPPPEPLDLIEQGDRLYSSVLCPCWEAAPSCRPSFGRLAALLATHMGEEGVADYAEQASNYERRRECLHAPLGAHHGVSGTAGLFTESGPAPRGYIRVESVDGRHNRQSNDDDGTDATDLNIGRPSAAGQEDGGEGYSVATVAAAAAPTAGGSMGYIGLSEVKQI